MRETDRLLNELREEGREPVLYTTGRRAQQYYAFRDVPVKKSWPGESDNPSTAMIHDVAENLLADFLNPDPEEGVSEIYLVFTRFHSMLKQVPEIRKMLPLTVVDHSETVVDADEESELNPDELLPEYEFIPDATSVLNQLLPLYVSNRIGNALLQSAASELAARQQAMHTATENADDLITNYTRLANAARQAEITQEITEIVSGADALKQQA